MDIDLLRTFRELQRTRHFGHAATNLFVSQSTVSARIKLLEEQLGARLFSRDRNNIRLTPAGVRFLPYAEQMIDTWTRARQTLVAGERGEEVVLFAAPGILWEAVAGGWLEQLAQTRPQTGISGEVLNHDVLLRRLLDGLLDLAFMFEEPRHEHLVTVAVAELELTLFASRPDATVDDALGDGYILVDWGRRFAAFHAGNFATAPAPRLRLAHLSSARHLLAQRGGAAYLPRQIGESTAGLLPVAAAPTFRKPVYAVFRRQPEAGADVHYRQLIGDGGLEIITPVAVDEVVDG